MMDAITTRFPDWLTETVARVAPGQRRSDAVRQLVIEAATEREFPMVIWRDGPSGRRPALRSGPDIEEVVIVARLHGQDPDLVDVAAEIGIPEPAVVDALRFAATFPAIVDSRIAVRERAVAAAPIS
jgi:hypothetical protein